MTDRTREGVAGARLKGYRGPDRGCVPVVLLLRAACHGGGDHHGLRCWVQELVAVLGSFSSSALQLHSSVLSRVEMCNG